MRHNMSKLQKLKKIYSGAFLMRKTQVKHISLGIRISLVFSMKSIWVKENEEII